MVEGGDSAQEEAEERLRLAHAELAEAQALAHLGHWSLDAATGEVAWSDELYRIFGTEPGRFVPRGFLHPADRERVLLQIAECWQTREPWTLEHRIVRADGAVRQVIARGGVTLDAGGEVVRMTGTIQDVTEQKAVETMKDEFLSVVSHELRTPLTSLRGALALLAGGVLGELPPEAGRMVEVAVGSTERLVRLVDGILDLERLTSGTIALAPAVRDVAGLLTQAVAENRGVADEAGVKIHLGAAEGRVRADPDRAHQVLTNLVSNAVKFSPEGSTVTVGAAPAGDRVRFEVTDQGRGIPPDQLERVFDRFHQVDTSDTRERGGTGLGLAIAKSIVDQHGGAIWAESTPGEGTTMAFTLPAAGEAAPAPGGPGVVVCDPGSSVPEDPLAAAGYQVTRVATPEAALAAAAADPPEAIVAVGREAATALAADPRSAGVPLVAVTDDEGPVVGAVARVATPVGDEDLLGALREALHPGERRVLVVEDDPAVAAVVATSLGQEGLATRRVGTATEAVRAARAFLPDVVVLDLAIPDGDGYAVVEALRRDPRLALVPLVVYTAFDLAEEDRDRLRLGETHVLVKGRTAPEAFAEQVRELLGGLTPEAP